MRLHPLKGEQADLACSKTHPPEPLHLVTFIFFMKSHHGSIRRFLRVLPKFILEAYQCTAA
ncbi:MAG: hypothetical protein ACTSXH_17000 [Promethearchaeota archaeon]